MNYFLEQHTNKYKIEAELDLTNNATKSDLKNIQALTHYNF